MRAKSNCKRETGGAPTLRQRGPYRLVKAVEQKGATLAVIAPKAGGVKSNKGKHVFADHALSAAASIFFDAGALLPSVEGGGLMAREAAAVDWLRDVVGHLKVIVHVEGSAPVRKGRDPVDADEAVVKLVGNLPAFIKAAKKHRVWEREPPSVLRGDGFRLSRHARRAVAHSEVGHWALQHSDYVGPVRSVMKGPSGASCQNNREFKETVSQLQNTERLNKKCHGRAKWL